MEESHRVHLAPPPDIKPPIGKGPFKCTLCEKIFKKWNQLQRHMKTHDEDKPFRCNKCSMSFNIEDNLVLHMATHVEADKNPTCPECDKTFSRVASLKAHIMMHEKEESLMCPECGDEFTVQHQLDRHMQTHRQEHEGARVHQCRQCNQEYSKLSDLREHMKQHYRVKASLQHRTYKRNIDRTGFSHKCKHCHKSFQKPSQLQRHERIHTGERPFQCKLCDKTFNQKGALQMHTFKHSGCKPFNCDFCPMTFAQKGNLRSHIKRVHTITKDENGGSVFKCEECSCMFRRLGSLNAHISRAHTEPESFISQETVQEVKVSLPCNLSQLADLGDSSIQDMLGLDQVTGPSDLSAASLVDGQSIQGSLDQNTSDILQQALENSGLRTGIDDQDVDGKDACIISSSGTSVNGVAATVPSAGETSRLATMAVHDSATGMIKRHYIRKINGIRWHQCTYCTKEFKKPSDLVRHIRIHTHEKPYKCTQCFRAFAVKSTLTAHIKTHSGIKDFNCEVCNKLFSTQGSLKVHLRLHTGAKPFQCNHCEKKFRTSAHCKAHVQSHFKDTEGCQRPRKSIRRPARNDALLADIPLQEPILITDGGLVQQQPRNTLTLISESGHPDRPFRCLQCRRAFKKSSHLKQHVRSHTGEKPFRCNICRRSFVSSGVLKAHTRTHSGEKSYKCLVCDAKFTTGGSLKRHMSTHSEVRPFMCPYCQKTFKTSVNCKKHMKIHRHELAIQQYQMKEADSAAVLDSVPAGEDQTIVEVQVDGLTASQGLADLDVLQDTSSVPQTDLQVDMSHSDLQVSGVNADTLTLDSGLQAFDQGMFGHSFTLVGQQPFMQQLASQPTSQQLTQDDLVVPSSQSQKLDLDKIPEGVTIQLDGPVEQVNVQSSSSSSCSIAQPLLEQPTTKFTYQPQLLSNHLDNTYTSEYIQQPVRNMSNGEQLQESENDTEVDSNPNPVMEQSRAVIQTHYPRTTSSRRTIRCQICSKLFKRANHLAIHMRSHGITKTIKCPDCPKVFSSNHQLKVHAATHGKIYKCDLCGAELPTVSALRRHAISHEQDENQPEVCVFCQEEFKNAAQLDKHLKICKMNESEDRKEELIKKNEPVFQRDSSDQQYSLSEKILIESNCEKNRISIPKEILNQTSQESRYANCCNYCPKSFKKPSDLSRHIRIHTGEKPYVCEQCNRAFTVKSTLDSHLRTHKTMEKQFTCHICSSMFSTKGSLKVHMRLHTGAKPFKCLHCDQRFRTSGHRKSHMTAHFKGNSEHKKRPTKSQISPLRTLAAAGDAPLQTQMFILTNGQHNTVNSTAINNQLVSTDQVMSIEQPLGSQVINVDQSLLQNQATVMPVLTVNDGDSSDVSQTTQQALPTSQLLQGIENGIQLQIGGTFNQPQQSYQLHGVDSGLLQQAIHIDASLIQQLQQNGFITINPSGLQPALTADLSQPTGTSKTTINAPVGSQNGENLVIQQPTASSNDAIISHLQRQPGSFVLQTLADGTASLVAQQTDGKLSTQTLQSTDQLLSLPIASSAQMMVNQRMSDTLLSQPRVGVTDSLLGQTVHTSQDSYIPSEAVVNQVLTSEGLIRQQLTHGMAASDGSEQNILHRMNIQSVPISEAVNPNIIVQPMSGLATHPTVKAESIELEPGTTFVTPDGQHVRVSAMNTGHIGDPELDLVKLQVVNEVDADKTQVVSIASLDESRELSQPVSMMDEDDDEEDEEYEEREEVDTNALIPTAAVVALSEKQQTGSERGHICGICFKGFKRSSHLRDHMKLHSSTPGLKKAKPTPYKCNVCTKAFQKPSQIQRHMRIHTGERPFTCNICSKSFNQKNALQIHERKHSGEKPHVCPYCRASFVQRGNLKTHVKRAHHIDMVNTMMTDRQGSTNPNSAHGEVEAGVDVSAIDSVTMDMDIFN